MADLAHNDLARTLAGVARDLTRVGTVQETLQRIVDLALQTIPDADCAGVMLLEDSHVTAPAATDLRVSELDALQARLWEGPGMDAMREQASAYSEDLAHEPGWPRFAPKAAERGMRSLLAIRLHPDDDVLGALNLYSRRPAAFDEADREVASLFAVHAAVALEAAERHADDVTRALHLQEALESRDLIGQAKGILMERQHIDADQAFDILRRASQRSNLKLRDVAALIVTPEDERRDLPGHR
jgi:GAF domain-containing protein